MKKYWKSLVVALPLALLLPTSCDKGPIEQHDEVIYYYYNNNNNPKWNRETLNKYAADKTVRNVYITVAPGESFKNCNADNISAQRRGLQQVMNISSKFSGRGNFDFTPGVCTRGDSLDLVAMGFTINQQNRPE